MSSLSPRIGLSYLLPSQAQKHVTVNESLRRLDALVHGAVVSATTTAQPASPLEGDAFILPTGRSGAAWSLIPVGHIAAFQDGGFVDITPVAGMLVYVRDADRLVLHDGSGWDALPMSALPMVGINTTADTTNRLSVKSDAELLSHDDVTPGSGDARKVINKALAARTASVVFQTGFSGRAEIGLIGDDKLSCKVSADGTTFKEILRVDATSGNVGIRRTTIGRALHVGGPADPGLRLQEDGADGYGELVNVSATQTKLNHVTPTGTATIDLNPQPSDGTSAASFRFFRETNTTADCRLDIHAGDNTSTVNHKLSTKSHSFLQVSTGFLRVGSGTTPTCTLDVAGPVRVASYLVAGVPSAAAGAGQIIFVSNESGGAVLAFSDGTAWRRVTDRAVIS